jgi:hypothetical protein
MGVVPAKGGWVDGITTNVGPGYLNEKQVRLKASYVGS